MAGFIYYFPSGPNPLARPEQIPSECNLKDVFADASISNGYCEHGPDNGAGPLVTIAPALGSGGSEASARYDAKTQTWEKVEVRKPDGTLKVTHWIGYENADPPAPKDLVRAKSVQGWPIEMRNGEWIVPTIHLPLTTLPMRYRMTADGPQTEVSEEYEQLCRDAAAWYQSDKNDKIADQFELVCKTIGVNYRVGPWELGSLGVLDSTTMLQCLKAAFGKYFIEQDSEMQQKKTLTRPVGV